MIGWIKIHRKIKEHWIWKDSMYLKAWITILLMVNYESKKVLIYGELIDCNRGQSLLSLQGWTEQFGKNWTIQKTRTFFELLRSDSMITTEGLQKTTRLTVCNYDDYQDEQQTDNTQKTFKQQTDNKQITTTKEREEYKEGKEREEVYPFECFWDDYGKKVDTKKCKDKWNKISERDRLLIQKNLPEYIRATPDVKFRKNPLTFLNAQCWNDEIITFETSSQPTAITMPKVNYILFNEDVTHYEKAYLENLRLYGPDKVKLIKYLD